MVLIVKRIMKEIIIVGAGAAGLYAAGRLANTDTRVTVVEAMPRAGTKLLITGKGRCNVTNNCTAQEFLTNVRTGARFVTSAIYKLPPEQLMDELTQAGVSLKTERGNRVFPTSDRARDILNFLLEKASGAKILYGSGVKCIDTEDGRVVGVTLQNGRSLQAQAVLIATGGISYPGTGSTGDGYRLAQSVGHSIVKPAPYLIGLRSSDGDCKAMMGLSLKNVAVSLFVDDKRRYREQGEMLFTHFGVSGPLILSASCELPRNFKKAHISVDLKPALDEKTLEKRIAKDIAALGAKTAAHCLDALIPKSMIPIMLRRSGIDTTLKANQITKAQRRKLVELFKSLSFEITGTDKIEHAIVTDGGVDTKEVNPKDMQSKKAKGLYFAGEVLDIAAVTGGYNLHIAFATAAAAAEGFCAT